MINRPFWTEKIVRASKTRSIVWLSGVRRAGKTSLARLLPDAIVLNGDLPSTQRQLDDPESYLRAVPARQTIVFDEIHQLPDPSKILNIAADGFPSLRVLATGSSTLAATRKFRDSLSGRKWSIYLSPVLLAECREEFGVQDLDKRLLHGGLPEPLLSAQKDPEFFEEWIDSFYARDIAELFRVRQRTGLPVAASASDDSERRPVSSCQRCAGRGHVNRGIGLTGPLAVEAVRRQKRLVAGTYSGQREKKARTSLPGPTGWSHCSSA